MKKRMKKRGRSNSSYRDMNVFFTKEYNSEYCILKGAWLRVNPQEATSTILKGIYY